MKKVKHQDVVCFNDLYFRLIGIPVLGFLIPIIFFDIKLDHSPGIVISHWMVSSIYTLIFWQGCRWIVVQFRLRFQRKEDEIRRLFLQFITVTVFASLVCIILGIVFHFLGLESEQDVEVQKTLVGSLSATYLILGIYEVVYFYKKWELALTETERFKKRCTAIAIGKFKGADQSSFFV